MNRPIRIPTRYTPTRMQSSRDCAGLLLQLQTVDFSIIDTLLYLDVYPQDIKAKEYLTRLQEERGELMRAMQEADCPPVTPDGNMTQGFRWVENPWPWESDAN